VPRVPVIRTDAPLWKLRRLQELRRLQAEKLGAVDVFRALGFEPNCVVRQAAAEAAGFKTIIGAVRSGVDLPPNCWTCPQERFLAHYNDERSDMLYGGAAGGGKTTGNLMGALRACHQFDGLQAFWFRRTFPELEQSVLRVLARYAYAAPLGAKWNGGRHELTFPNGSILTFGHAANLKAATALLSAEIQLLCLDERTTIQPDVVDFIYTRVRSGVEGIPELGIRSGTNPGEIGHSRVKTDFIEATDHGANELVDERGRTLRFIQAKATDTPQVIMSGYLLTLQGIKDPQLRKAMLDGDWDVFAGQVFSEWRYAKHVVEPFTLPREWRRCGGIDYGYRAPSAVLKSAVDGDGRVWVYWELYETQLGERRLAEEILASGAEHVVYAFDPSMSARIGDEMPVASILQEEGVPLTPGNNDRLSGWNRIHTYLADGPACQIHRAAGSAQCPLLHVFAGCVDLIRTLPAVPYRTTGKLEDVDTESEDHLPDALRYLLMELGGMNEPYVSKDRGPTTAPDGSPLLPVLDGRMIAGDTSTGLAPPPGSQKGNGRVIESPFV
jgi:hypothetical protein